LTSEADDNSSLDVSEMAMIGVIVCHFLIACADLLVTSCHLAFLVARPLMNWRSLLYDVFGFVDSISAVRLLRTSRQLVGCIAICGHFVSACYSIVVSPGDSEGHGRIVEAGLDSSTGIEHCIGALRLSNSALGMGQIAINRADSGPSSL
jgi:hypothetical protein